MNPVNITEGSSQIILAQPHGGTYFPPLDDVQNEIIPTLNEIGRELADTDWHIHRLYDGLIQDATVVEATFSRYLIDANRDPSGNSLYPGQNTTELCPTIDFEGRSIYQKRTDNSVGPDVEEIGKRCNNYHSVYHTALSKQIERVRKKHGQVLLFDCHSIRSCLPFLFEGELPDFNLGTNNTTTCDPKFEEAAVKVCSNANGYSYVLNGRFKGGWTTRHYGNPEKGIHAIQLELSQRTYMIETAPWLYNEEKAAKLRVHLKNLLSCLEQTISSLT